MLIYKLCPRALWEAAVVAGQFTGSEHDHRDGFIHLSTEAQLAETAAKYFAGLPDILLLAVDTKKLGDALKFETSRGGALFPHLYGPLPLSAVVEIVPFSAP